MIEKFIEHGHLLVRLFPQGNPRVTSIHNSSLQYKVNNCSIKRTNQITGKFPSTATSAPLGQNLVLPQLF